MNTDFPSCEILKFARAKYGRANSGRPNMSSFSELEHMWIYGQIRTTTPEQEHLMRT